MMVASGTATLHGAYFVEDSVTDGRANRVQSGAAAADWPLRSRNRSALGVDFLVTASERAAIGEIL